MSLGGENRDYHSLIFAFDKWRLPDSNWRAKFDRPYTSPEQPPYYFTTVEKSSVVFYFSCTAIVLRLSIL